MSKSKKKVITETVTEIICVIDKSGSMAMVRGDAIGGFNSFLKDQQLLPDKARMTVVLFDTEYYSLYKGEDIKKVKPLDEKTYCPGGTTALIDAIGKTIDESKSRVVGGNKVIFVIITDGYENSSREYTTSQIKEKIEEQTKNGWNFLYLGANQDAFAEAGKYGINPDMVAGYSHNNMGTRSAYVAMSRFSSALRSGDEELKENWKDDVK